jgi:hypothetical protein
MTAHGTPRGPAQQIRSRNTGRVPLIIILIALSLSSAYLVIESEEGLPLQLGELTLYDERSGDDARQIIDRLHGKSVTPIENFIGEYAGPAGKATLYLSVYSGREEAVRIQQRMAGRIREGNSVFGQYTELTIADYPVAFCRGMGQAHYFFSSGMTVYWLAVDDAVSSTAIASLLSQTAGSVSLW